MNWQFATLVVAVGGAILGAAFGYYAKRDGEMLPAERAMAGLVAGALGALLLFVLFSAVAGLLYFFGDGPSWWPLIGLSWLLLAAFGGGYAFPDAKLGGRQRQP